MRKRLRADQGFGLIELLMAMVILNIGILAIVASFNAGIFTLNRASRITTASVLADQQMELFRAIEYESIRLASATIPATAPYTTDPAYSATQITAPSWAPALVPQRVHRHAPGDQADGKPYRVNTYIVEHTGQRPARQAGDHRRPRRRRPDPRVRGQASSPTSPRAKGGASEGRWRAGMAAYTYSAINAQGIELSGNIHAPDRDAAREQLRVRRLLAQNLVEQPASGEQSVATVFKKIKPSLQIFSRQFATMIDAGLSVVGALVILEEQTEDKYLSVDRQGAPRASRRPPLSQALGHGSSAGSARWSSGGGRGILDQVLDRRSSRSRRRQRSSAA